MEDVEQTPKALTIVIRPELKRACCEGDACRAAILNQLLYCIAWKLQKGKEYWYGTYDEIWKTLLDESWGKSKVIKEINVLVEQGYLEQRRNPTKGWDQTRQYLFGKKQAQKLKEACEKAGICAHQIGFPSIVIHLLDLTNGFSENNKCISCKQQMQSLDSTNPSVENNRAIPKNTTKTPPKTSSKNIPNTMQANTAGQSEEDKNINNIIDFPEQDHQEPEKLNKRGYIKIYMRSSLKAFRSDTSPDAIIDHVHDIFLQAQPMDIADFETKIVRAFNDTKNLGLEYIRQMGYKDEMEYFFASLCKSLKLQYAAMEG